MHYELVVGRDEKSVELGFPGLGSKSGATPGQLEDHEHGKQNGGKRISAALPKGVFSPAIGVLLDTTVSLWNSPAFPSWDTDQEILPRLNPSHRHKEDPNSSREECRPVPRSESGSSADNAKRRKQKKVHLVVLTHGLHSNLGSDMLYLKESIDAAAKQAKEDAQIRKSSHRKLERQKITPKSGTQNSRQDSEFRGISTSETEQEATRSFLNQATEDDESDEEEVIVRGFAHNACRTERGIQYLGKRLAKWVLSVTYPDQEYLPQKKSVKKKLSRVFTGDLHSSTPNGKPQHSHSSIYHPANKPEEKAYKITSISFIAHSLGGLTQTYAIAYIHKHSPHFFDEIKPINFVAMAAPFLGLSNENPLYVRFALDFGLVGRTGQDLGLTWRAPTMVRSGWGAMIGGIGSEGQRTQKQLDPGSKPLLRILPTGHTHQVLKKFRNRTVYSNVVNDGIVPLRTSCLLFLDWSGLGRVEKARRGNGLIGTTLGWGWAELTGINSSSRAQLRAERDSEVWSQSDVSNEENPSGRLSRAARAEVPQPASNAVIEDNTKHDNDMVRSRSADARGKSPNGDQHDGPKRRRSSIQTQLTSPVNGLLTLLRPNSEKRAQSPKVIRMYKRGQTTKLDFDEIASPSATSPAISRTPSPHRPRLVRGDSITEDPDSNVYAPPKTTIFESAGDVLNPPLPSREFIIDPESRPRTIFHDRVYHPDDIPPPPARKPSRISRSPSFDSKDGLTKITTNEEDKAQLPSEFGVMKVEEKIARAYHHGLSWRKVLVRLEPDAHNNMVVRRMFANAYGWPVVKHLVDTHFADTYEAKTADVFEPNEERARPVDETVSAKGEEVDHPAQPKAEIRRTDSELREAVDNISDLRSESKNDSKNSSFSTKYPILSREDSAQWDDTLFEVSDDDSEEEQRHASQRTRHQDHSHPHRPHIFPPSEREPESPKGTSEAEIAAFLTKSPVPNDSPLTPDKDKNAELKPSPAGGTSTIGLGKTLEEQLNFGSPVKLVGGQLDDEEQAK